MADNPSAAAGGINWRRHWMIWAALLINVPINILLFAWAQAVRARNARLFNPGGCDYHFSDPETLMGINRRLFFRSCLAPAGWTALLAVVLVTSWEVAAAHGWEWILVFGAILCAVPVFKRAILLSARSALVGIGVCVDAKGDRLAYPSATEAEGELGFGGFCDACRLESVRLSAIESIGLNNPTGLDLRGDFLDRRIEFGDAGRRDACLAAIRKVTGKAL